MAPYVNVKSSAFTRSTAGDAAGSLGLKEARILEELSKEDVEMKKALGQGLQSPLERRRGQANRDAETGDAMKVRKSGAEVKEIGRAHV